ncbi:MAG: hypothetical protein H6656_02535 [Ardenticatenaceae bacterium]|nr:hypothetical protein [Ardenticatenaceae bacterium]
MTELVQEPVTKKKSFMQRLRENPVTVKELRSRMRGRRAFVVLTVHLLVMSGFITWSIPHLPHRPAARTAQIPAMWAR